MLELLSPAGSPEAVIAAVQNGADAVYMGLGSFNARRGAKNFDYEEFARAARYCRIRNCKVYVTMNTLVNDREIPEAVALARRVCELGADAILVQDLGLLSVLRRALPDMPLHASTQMSIHSLEGVKAAAAMGLTRAVLARELSFEQIKYITENSPIETEIFVHGALCFCHSGQCYMSSMIGRRSGNRGMCAQPCRMEYSMNGRMAEKRPLSLKDSCLVDRLREIEAAGVACVKIEGRMKRPEYTGLVTGIYSSIIKEQREPTSEELRRLEEVFSRQGFTQGYFDGTKSGMFGFRDETKANEKLFSEARRSYIDSEINRVPVKFGIGAMLGKPLRAAVKDLDGHCAELEDAPPEKGISQTADSESVSRQLQRTGGTPYRCYDIECTIGKDVFLPASKLNDIRRRLLRDLSDMRAELPARRSLPIPEPPKAKESPTKPKTIYQLRTSEQLSEELAELAPDYLYLPAELMLSDFDKVRLFTDKGSVPVAVLPRVITDTEQNTVLETLKSLRELGVKEALVGNIGHIQLAREAGMSYRADFGMNSFNSYTLELLKYLGVLSATASFELRIAQVRDLQKCIDTELIVYGRMPLMVSDQCVISHSEGRCACQNPASLQDRTGSVFPIVREFEHRNVIYNSKKLFLADKTDDLLSCGLWGLRHMFTTESARECLQIAKSYAGEGDFKPNDLTRGLYYRGVD